MGVSRIRLSMKNSFLVYLLAALVLAATGLTGCQQRKGKKPGADATALGQGPGDTLPMTPGGDAGLAGDGSLLNPRDPNALGGADAAGKGRGILQSVFFDFDRAEIKPAERTKLEAAATYLKANSAARLMLEGHCDWRGTTEYNLGLGDRRSQSVKTFLQNLGVSADRLEIISKGDTEAKEGAADSEMAKDRRVEFVVLGLP
jgi:peptidoglycan-associated lipoprotein